MDGVVPSLTVEDVVTPWLKYGWNVVSGGLLNLRVGSVLGERLVVVVVVSGVGGLWVVTSSVCREYFSFSQPASH